MKFIKGTAAQVAASTKTGTAGDLVTESDTGNLRVADGSTLLGALKRLVRYDEVPILTGGKVPEANIPTRLSDSNLNASYAGKLDNASTSANGALTVEKLTKVDASGAARAMTIPDGTIKGQQVAVEKTDTSTNAVTVTGKIRSTGSSAITLTYQYETLVFIWGGTFWEPLAGHRTKASLDATYVGALVAKGAGLDPTGATDSSAAIQALINAVHAGLGSEVVLPPGTFLATNLNIGDGTNVVKLKGQGTIGRWTNPAWKGSTTLKNLPGASSPLLAMLKGAEAENITLDGNGNTAQPILYGADGFEARLRHIRIVNNATTGLDLFQANNTHFDDVFVDSCGSSTAAAVRVRSYSPSTVSNGLMLFGLTIEGSPNSALDIATGTGVTTGTMDYAEFIQIFGLHIEGGGHTGPLVKIGNVRSVDLVAPFLVGGPGPLIKYDEQVGTSGVTGGLKVIGGALIGAAGANTPVNLVDLNAGDGFTIGDGAVLDNCSGAAVTVRSTFGGTVNIGHVFPTRVGSLASDARTTGRINRTVGADTAWRVPTLAGAWTNAGFAGYTDAGYRIDAAGIVHLRGIVTTGTGTIFTLPAGYRPGKNLQVACCGTGATYAAVEIDSNGDIIHASGTKPIDLSSISFLAEL